MIFRRILPDSTSCRTRHVHGDVYRCLAENGWRCAHMVPFAQSLYCRHPECGDYTVNGRSEAAAGYALTA